MAWRMLGAITWAWLFATAVFAAPKPHIVLIVVDDMGYYNLHAPPHHNNSEIHSPAMARLASEGVVLTNYYAYPICGPSRASLMTGRFPGHGISEQMFSPAMAKGYNSNLTMLPEKLRQAGYATHALGKWHCGFWQRKFLPTNRGFDTFTGFLSGSEDHFDQRTVDTCGPRQVSATDLWQDLGSGSGGSNAFGLNGTYDAYTYTQLAVDIIRSHAQHRDGQPLFLYFAMHNIHGPMQADQRFQDIYDEGMFEMRRTINAMVSTADETLSNITSALDEVGMATDTLLVMVSDNGGPIVEPSKHWSPANNFPLRGGKYSYFEGGINVVAMARYPRLLSGRAGQMWHGLMHASDWYATFCSLAGVDPSDSGPGKIAIDSINTWPGIVSGGESPRQELIVGMAEGNHGAYRSGPWKLVVGRNMGAWVGKAYPNRSTPGTTWPDPEACSPACLFNLAADPREELDLFKHHPVKGGELLNRFRELVGQLSAVDHDGDFPHGKITDPDGCRLADESGWWQPWAKSDERHASVPQLVI